MRNDVMKIKKNIKHLKVTKENICIIDVRCKVLCRPYQGSRCEQV
jgi:hypothetical protein